MSYLQQAFIQSSDQTIQIELPSEYDEVLPNVKWGNVAGFPTVSYWLYRVLEQRENNETINYKLGNTLIEEVGACLLGGHGIPAANGLAAYEHMKEKGTFNGSLHSEEQLLEWLAEPITLNNKTFKYRFVKQKAKYLYHALVAITDKEVPSSTGKELRNWLLDIKGIGLKTASWIARNWLDADDIAILDIHIYRAGLLGGFFNKNLTVERNYLELEERFVDLANAMKIRTSELDALMWFEIQQSNTTLQLLQAKEGKKKKLTPRRVTDHSSTYTGQLALI